MGRLTTHVLDTSRGRPGAGIRVDVYRAGEPRRLLRTLVTNADGRADRPLLEGTELSAGVFELVFHAGDWFRQTGLALPEPAFVDEVVLRFGIADPDAHYHVPLLVSPWSYSTYRGS